MKLLLTNIKQLLQVRETNIQMLKGAEMQDLPYLENAWLLLENGRIESFGEMPQIPEGSFDKVLDCAGRMVLPTWVDSHTHIVYAGNREQEFIHRINGLSYQEIAEKGGGILNSAKKLQQASEEELFEQAALRLEAMMQQGTGAVEIKSGYGLTTEAEIKMLRVAKELAQKYSVSIKTTLLGAHAIPANFKDQKSRYLNLVIEEMIPQVAAEQLADFIDIFCEEGYFSVADTERVLEAGTKFGLTPKIHVNQFTALGGVAAGVKYNALSVDHLEHMNDEDIEALQGSQTMPTALPACSYFLGIPYTPARRIIDSGLPLALATDYNPGSSPTGNMNFVVSAACIKMKMTPEEAINAATINGAYAMGLAESHGSITPGKVGSVIITEKIPTYGFLPYSFGSDHIHQVIIKGKLV